MSGEDLTRRYVSAVNDRDPEAFQSLFAEDGVIHDPFLPEPVRGRLGARELIEGVFRAFPDMQWEQTGGVIDGGDRIAFVVSVKATNTGPFAMPGGDVPPSGRAMAYQAAVHWIVSGGQIVEERSYWDTTGVAAQLGMAG